MRAGSNVDKKVAILGFSFGLSNNEPNKSNRALVWKFLDAVEYVEFNDSVPFTALQWEMNKGILDLIGESADCVAELREDGVYLDSKLVWAAFKKAIETEGGIKQVIIIAQPFLHMRSLKSMIRKDDFEIIEFEMGEIPFYDSLKNTQPWTRSKPALALYAMKSLSKSVISGFRGKLGLQPSSHRMQSDT